MREKLAELCHQQWSGWMKYLFSKCTINEDGSMTIPPWAVSRWLRQATTPYSELLPEEQDSDRKEADRFIAVLERGKP